ncbi:MAG: lipoyl synthase [Candidatus Omnitrophota bacterium]
MRKPKWFDKKIELSLCHATKTALRGFNLHTVCESSLCPNISECFNAGNATFMILGDRCTRSCAFCSVSKEKPLPIDRCEPQRIAKAVEQLQLRYVVLTSPTRDDLDDGGSSMFCETAKEIKNSNPSRKVEMLIPDFLGRKEAIAKVASCGAEVIAHNVETVPSLYIEVRAQADFERSLRVLALLKASNVNILTKSSLMLGLGEKEAEIIEVFKNLRAVHCDFLTLGQYLAPSLRHYPVKEYINPQQFSYLEEKAYSLGFKKVQSSPYTRSSYLAHTFLSSGKV